MNYTFERIRLTDYDRHDFAKHIIELDIGLMNIFHEFIFSFPQYPKNSENSYSYFNTLFTRLAKAWVIEV